MYLNVGRFDLARSILNTVIADSPNDERLYNLLGLVYHKESNFAAAIKNFKISREKAPNYLEATLNLIITLCDVGLYDAALTLFQSHRAESSGESVVSNPATLQLVDLHCELGESYALMGSYSDAACQFEIAFKLADGAPTVGYKLARMYIECGHFDKAQHLLRNIMKSSASDVHALNLLGLVFHCQKQFDKAKEQWSLSQKIDPSDNISASYLSLSPAL